MDIPKTYYPDSSTELWLGDALDALRELPSGSIDCLVTSPPLDHTRVAGLQPR